MLLTNLPSLYYRLLKNDSATRILANPQLRTSEGIPAQARFGERVPVPVTTFAPIAAGGVQTQPITSFNYEPIGVNIDITPRMHHDDAVTLALKVELSSISGKGFGDLPTFGSRQINTVIRLKDGETNMLAGLIRDEERTSLATIPGLSDIPVIGRLFAYNHKETQETDIILTLTPRIVRVLNLTAEDLQAFRVGRDGGAPLTDIVPPLPLPLPLPPPKPPGGDAAPSARAAVPRPPGPGDAGDAAGARQAAAKGLLDLSRPTRPASAAARPAGCSRARPFRAARRGSARPRSAPRQSAPFPIEYRGCRAILPRSRRGPVTMMRCGSHRNRSAPMPLICSSANSRSSYIQSCTSVAPSACVASTVTRLTRSLGKPGPQAGRDAARADQLLTTSTRKTSLSCTHLHAHLA